MSYDIVLCWHNASPRTGARPADGRPYQPSQGGHSHWRLNDPIHEWLTERKISYKFRVTTVDPAWLTDYSYVVTIQNARDAILFKLTWGGE